ncbi:MAG TPA: VWA domain-containing protein [Terriglobales bacterium]|nr:VWA domain-containing protein [Terriglobales bacterium]
MRSSVQALLLVIGICCPISPLAQAPIHVDVHLVDVAFAARSANGTLVNNLSQEDVEVLEDAVPQKISFFARSADVPLTLGLIVDFSGSQEHFQKKHRHDLEVFLKEMLGPHDRVFLVAFGNRLRLVSDLSQSADELGEKWERFEKGDRNVPDLGPVEDRELGTAFYDAIYYSVTTKLAGIQNGRKALLVFSDGEDNSSSHHLLDAIEAAQNENVIVYSIRYTEKRHGRLTARNKYGMRVMERIAHDTGGTDFDAEKTDTRAYFHQISEELRTSYELAYYPTNPARDDSFRKIAIRPRQPGLTVRCKTGYFSR